MGEKQNGAMAGTDKKTAKDFIYLAACALNGAQPDESYIDKMNMPAVMQLAQLHNMGALIAHAYTRSEAYKNLPKAEAERWEAVSFAAVRGFVFKRKELERVLAALEEAGIWYCPIKGIEIAACYPIPGLREMADCDVLVDENRPDDVKSVMESLGYSQELFGESNHDVYHRQPMYNFEMHRQLFNLEEIQAFDRYYENVKERLVKDAGNAYGFHFSHEDEYIFNIAHSFKHFRKGGTGMKALADAFAIRRKYPDMDEAYMMAELKKLELTDFERRLRETAEALFGQSDNIYRQELSKDQEEIVAYLLGSGAYGTRENTMHNALVRLGNEEKISLKTRIRYILDRIYPKGFRYEEKYAFFYRHKWAYPFLPIYRLFVRGDVKSAIREAKRSMKTK
jgi:hypothetical protein